MLFKNRTEAGQKLAAALSQYGSQRSDEDPLVLALPRGGVPVAFQVARALGTQLDVFIVRKLGAPGQPELALGAIASGGTIVWNHDILRALGLPDARLQRVLEHENAELIRREREYRGHRPQPRLSDRTILLIDDGLATGATMRAAVQAIQAKKPKKLVAAVPVASREACNAIQPHVDHIICLQKPDPFYGVGAWYDDFSQTSDQEVHQLLAKAYDQTKNSHEKPDPDIFPDL